MAATTRSSSTRQRRGVGTMLVAIAARHAKQAGCEWRHVDFELEAFYLRACGFRSTLAGLLHLTPIERSGTSMMPVIRRDRRDPHVEPDVVRDQRRPRRRDVETQRRCLYQRGSGDFDNADAIRALLLRGDDARFACSSARSL
jgi:hypothetical protein